MNSFTKNTPWLNIIAILAIITTFSLSARAADREDVVAGVIVGAAAGYILSEHGGNLKIGYGNNRHRHYNSHRDYRHDHHNHHNHHSHGYHHGKHHSKYDHRDYHRGKHYKGFGRYGYNDNHRGYHKEGKHHRDKGYRVSRIPDRNDNHHSGERRALSSRY